MNTFFSKLGEIAHKQQKRVYQADPNNRAYPYIDKILGVIGVSALIHYAIDLTKKASARKLSRREFLKKAAFFFS